MKEVTYYRHPAEARTRFEGAMRYRANVVGRQTQTVEVALWEDRGGGTWASRERYLFRTVSLRRARHLCALLNDQIIRLEMGDR